MGISPYFLKPVKSTLVLNSKLVYILPFSKAKGTLDNTAEKEGNLLRKRHCNQSN